MDLFGTGAADLIHLGLGGGATDDRIIDDDDAFITNQIGDDVEFQPNGGDSLILTGLDKGAANIAIRDDAFAIRDAAGTGISGGGGASGIGHGHDVVGTDRGLAAEDLAEGLAGGLDVLTEDIAGRVGEAENALKASGVADFIYMGCDVLAMLTTAHRTLAAR